MFGQTSGVSSTHQHEEKVHISIHVSTNILRGVSIMFGRTSGVSSPHQHEEKTFISVNVCLQIFGFRCTTPTSARPQLFSFFICGTRKNPSFFSAPAEREETLHHRPFYACQIIYNPPGIFERVRHFGHLL